jgi:hypothetical protein
MKTHSPYLLLPCLAALALSGCATFSRPTVVSSIPCTYRFKMITRPEDQARIEAAINSVAVGSVTKTGTLTFPEYHFRVIRLAALDTLHPKLLYNNPDTFLSGNRKQVLNLKTAGVDVTLDSTDVSASAITTVTFHVKPGSRLYYKNPGEAESDITAKVSKSGKVTFPATIREGQKYIFARAMKDNVTRYIRINIFTNEVKDVTQRDY